MAGKITKVANPEISMPGNCMDKLDIAIAGISKGNQMGDKVNPYGTGVMRGGKAQTKGKKISGKMG